MSSRYPVGHPRYQMFKQHDGPVYNETQSANNSITATIGIPKLLNNQGENLCFVNTSLQLLRSCRQTSAEKLRNLVATASGRLDMASGSQQDIEEFLNLMLLELEKELASLGLSNIVSDNFMSRDKIVKKFLLRGQSAGVCPNCQHVPAELYDPFSVLRLPVPKRGLSRSNPHSTLAQLISQHYSEEIQPGMKCSKCCQHRTNCPRTGKCTPISYTEQRVLIKSPNILIVQLMRFSARRKLLTKVSPDNILTLPNGDRYQLVSISE